MYKVIFKGIYRKRDFHGEGASNVDAGAVCHLDNVVYTIKLDARTLICRQARNRTATGFVEPVVGQQPVFLTV